MTSAIDMLRRQFQMRESGDASTDSRNLGALPGELCIALGLLAVAEAIEKLELKANVNVNRIEHGPASWSEIE